MSSKIKRKAKKEVEKEELKSINIKLSQPIDPNVKFFNELPISSPTQYGLKSASFVEMTEIQKDSLPLSLRGKDILGAAKTGSGKTLAFLICVLEKLYRAKWCKEDGLGALILTPTRELALQIFQVLRSIGKNHSFSAGLIIGGKDFDVEQERIGTMNILICTPGRLLQHMDQTASFQVDNLQILVLDEADRILDMGFEKTVNAILAGLPKQRQTLLFSATQNASVKDLARLSLKDPEYVSVHEKAENATPQQLQQYYINCPLQSKLDHLFSFLRKHSEEKILVFASSCKQVRFITESFKLLRVGIPVLPLFGKQKQVKRMAIFQEFCSKKSICLVATDIAARGLDFPKVDWVIQLDAPEDVATYIHRVGRTARYENSGNALLFLLPSEEALIDLLKNKKVPIEPIKFSKVAKLQSIQQKLMGICCQNTEMKYLAQKSLVSYVRSVYLQSNKNVFKVNELPVAEFATAIGLPGIPRLRFVERNEKKNENRQLAAMKSQKKDNADDNNDENDDESSDDENSENENESEADETKDETQKPHRTIDKFFKKKNVDVLSSHYDKLREKEEDSDQDEEFLKITKKDHEIDVSSIPLSRRDMLKAKKKYLLKTNGTNQKFVFDDEGEAKPAFPYATEKEFLQGPVDEEISSHLEQMKENIEDRDVIDKEREKEARKEKKLEQKRKLANQDSSEKRNKF